MVRRVLKTSNIYDPCPVEDDVKEDGLKQDWGLHPFIYCNPPIPAAIWAYKALETAERHNNESVIMFAAFSPSVLFQEPRLLDYPICFCRKRIKWIDGRKMILGKAQLIDNELVIQEKPNPNFGKGIVGSTAYSAFVLLGANTEYVARFKSVFESIGKVTSGFKP
jgi:hypothetical protein